jgi:peptidoglycan L-alanyl-D-glutamate endopeptidase CwlK
MPFNLSVAGEAKLKGVHPDLARVVRRAITLTPVDFRVTEGMPTVGRQKQIVAAGASETMNSPHLKGHAVDLAALVGGKVCWDWPLYPRIAAAMKEAAGLEGVPLEWGAAWKRFKDGPHYQLPFKSYPE